MPLLHHNRLYDLRAEALVVHSERVVDLLLIVDLAWQSQSLLLGTIGLIYLPIFAALINSILELDGVQRLDVGPDTEMKIFKDVKDGLVHLQQLPRQAVSLDDVQLVHALFVLGFLFEQAAEHLRVLSTQIKLRGQIAINKQVQVHCVVVVRRLVELEHID